MTYIYICVCVCVFIYILNRQKRQYIYIYIYIYVYIYCKIHLVLSFVGVSENSFFLFDPIFIRLYLRYTNVFN